MPRRKPAAPITATLNRAARVAFQARRCSNCGGTVIIGAEKFHDCPGPKMRQLPVTVADGTRGMERGR